MTLDIFIQPFVQWTWKTRDNIVQNRLNVSTHLKLRGSILMQTAVPSSHCVRKRVKWLHAIVYPGTKIAQAVSWLAASWTTWIPFPLGERFVLVSTASLLFLWHTHALITRLPGTLFRKQISRSVNVTTQVPSSAEVENTWSFASTPCMLHHSIVLIGVVEWLTFLVRIREAPGLNIVAETGNRDWVFRGFSQSLQANSRIVPYK
jgi:hypothetical protein